MKTDKYPYSPVCRVGGFIVKKDSSGHVVQVSRYLVHTYESKGIELTKS
jgi:hypothetical protein